LTHRVQTLVCAGGLDEVSSDFSAAPGTVRRSLNYEALAEGGYRRIGGMRRWSGRDVSPRYDALQAVLVNRLDPLPDGAARSTANGVRFRSLATAHRGTHLSVSLIEKERATEKLSTGDVLFPTGEYGPSVIVNTDIPLLESERVQFQNYLSEGAFYTPFRGAGGAGEVVYLGAMGGHVYAVQMNDEGKAVIQRARHEGGFWQSFGVIPVDDPSKARWSAYVHAFPGLEPRMFFVNGQTAPFYVEGIEPPVYIDDTVPLTESQPTHVTAHQQHLMLAFPGGRVLHSALGNPASFDTSGGAGEFGVGDEITGFQALPGGALAIFCADRISILTGTSVDDWRVELYSDEAGAIPGTLQDMPTAIFCDRRGITTLGASDRYGGFVSKALSQRFDETYQRIRQGARLFSVVSRDKSQYRLLNEDGRGLYLTFAGSALAGAMEVDLGHTITAVGIRRGDDDEIFVATGDGWVHRLDAGGTFSGEVIDAFLEFHDFHYGRPRLKKRFHKAVLEFEGDPRLGMSVTSVLDDGEDAYADSAAVDITPLSRAAPGYRPDLLSRFMQAFRGVVYLIGTGLSQSLRLEPTSTHEHEVKSIIVHYTDRGQAR